MKKTLLFTVLMLLLAGCASASSPENNTEAAIPSPTVKDVQPTLPIDISQTNECGEEQQIAAIAELQKQLGLPELDVTFYDTSNMINSPSGNLEVNSYQDTESRMFYVSPQHCRVVEIDARLMLILASSETGTQTIEEIEPIALESANKVTDQDLSLLTYQPGNKGDVYFFDWYETAVPGMMNPPRLQIGYDANGVLFAYIHTLGLGTE